MGWLDALVDVVKVAGPVVANALSKGDKSESKEPSLNLTAGKETASGKGSSVDSDTLGTVVDLVGGLVKNTKLTKSKAQTQVSKAFGNDDHCDLQAQAAEAIENAFKGGLNADEKKKFTALKAAIGASMKEGGISGAEVEKITLAIGDLNKSAGVSR